MQKNGDVLGYLKKDLNITYQSFSGDANPIAVVVSGLNNTWSLLNTINDPDKTVGDKIIPVISSFLLVIGDGIDLIAKDRNLKRFVSVARMNVVMYRLTDSIQSFQNQTNPNNHREYDNGLVKFQTVLDIFSDSALIFSEVTNFTKFNPIGLLANILSLFATQTSNSLSKEKLNNPSRFPEKIEVGEIYEYLIEGAKLAIKNWDSLKPLENMLDSLLPDILEPWKSPDETPLSGTDKDDVINEESWFDKEYYVVYAYDGNDTITGSQYSDYLNGGNGNDILIGKGGNDKFEDGEGFDTYHIQDNDIIIDEDLSGQIIFKETIQAAQFQRIDKNANLWLGLDSKGNQINGLEAASVGWATRCPRDSDSWDFTQLFLFSANIHNILIPPTSPRYFRQPESSQLKYRDIFLQKHNAKLFDKNEPYHNNGYKIQFSGCLNFFGLYSKF